MKTGEYLDKVLQLQRERQQAKKIVLNATTKKLGLCLVEISDDEKEKMNAKIKNFYDSRITSIYDTINNDLERSGQKKLNNPFERT